MNTANAATAMVPPPEVTPPEVTPDEAERLAQDTVCLDLVIRSPSFTRRGDLSKVQTDADRTLLHLSRDLIDQRELQAIRRLDSQFKRQLLTLRCIQSSLFRGGIYLVPLGVLAQLDEEIATYRRERLALVDQLLARWDDIRSLAAQRLRDQYDPADYPAPAAVRASFDVEVRYFSFNFPAAIERVNRDLFAREREKIAAQWRDAYSDVRDALRGGMLALVQRLAASLGTDEAGKPKRLYDSTVDRLVEFLNVFDARNLTDDAALATLVAQARAALAGTPSATLIKGDPVYRAQLATQFATITEQVAQLTTSARAFAAPDEDI